MCVYIYVCVYTHTHTHTHTYTWYSSFPCGSDGKESACNVGDPGSIPGSRRLPGEGNGNPLQYFCLENPMNGETWQTTVFEGSQRVRHD